MNNSLGELAKLVQGVVIGDESIIVSTLSPIDGIQKGSLVFAEGEENFKRAESSDAAAVLVSKDRSSTQKPLIQVENPFNAFVQLLHHFYPEKKIQPQIHPTAVIAEGVVLGTDVFVGPYVVIETGSMIGNGTILKSHIHIGQNVLIGMNCIIHPHVTVYNGCHIGSEVIIHASTVIGSDGFGYTFAEGQHQKIPHKGQVIIEDKVEIGANSAIDRATLGATIIGQGTKIDNLVQVAHSVKLGKHNILCAFTGIAGSSTTGNHVIFAANVGVSDHVQIDDGVILGARTGVPPKKHLKSGTVYLGSPAKPKDDAIKHELSVTRIPLMRKNIRALTEQVDLLNKRLTKIETE